MVNEYIVTNYSIFCEAGLIDLFASWYNIYVQAHVELLEKRVSNFAM